MLIGITGAQRSGKTLTMTALSLYLSESMGVPLYSSYGIKYSKELTSIDQLQNLDNAIVAIDDFYQDLDSRNFKNNIVLTQFINNVAKKQLIVFFVTHTLGFEYRNFLIYLLNL